MSIYLSATAIKDYIACPKKIFYRTNFPELAETTVNMEVGTIVHSVVEKYWENEASARSYCGLECIKQNLSGEMTYKAELAIRNFFQNPVYGMLKRGDLVEHKFKIALDENSYLVGKIDRILGNGTVIDWKTSTTTPRTIDKDPQFITYFYAYKSLFKKNPTSVLYVSLFDNKVVRLNVNFATYQQLFHTIVPSMVTKIKRNDLPALGLFNGSCYGCLFKKSCLKDMEGEVGT